MGDPYLVLTPLVVLLIVLLFRLTGCSSILGTEDWSAAGPTGETFVIPAEVPGQSAKGIADDAVAATASFPNSVTGGNLLVVAGTVWERDGANAIATISDLLNTKYTLKEFVSPSDGHYRVFIAFGIALDPGPNSVTITTAAPAFCSFGIDEFTGVNKLDVDGGGVSGGPNTTPGAPLTTGGTALIVGTMCVQTGVAVNQISPGSGFEQIAEEEDDSNHVSFNAEFTVTEGSQAAWGVDWTLGASSTWVLYRVSFKA
jgi:hypothetical protein